MCSLCAVLGSSTHWTDAAGRPGFERAGLKVTSRAERERRVGLLNAILAGHGVKVLDWGGNSFVVENTTGKSENVYTLNAIWGATDRLAPRYLDPLDESFLAEIELTLERNP